MFSAADDDDDVSSIVIPHRKVKVKMHHAMRTYKGEWRYSSTHS
jgi:hypothetical protein